MDVEVEHLHASAASPVVDRLEIVDRAPHDPSWPEEPGWFDGVAFTGPLDPAGTLFAFLLALAATVGLVVLVAGVVRALGAA
jgi:hypothetical protein